MGNYLEMADRRSGLHPYDWTVRVRSAWRGFPVFLVPPRIHLAADNQALSEVSSDYKPPQENMEALLSHPDKSHTPIGTPPHTLMS